MVEALSLANSLIEYNIEFEGDCSINVEGIPLFLDGLSYRVAKDPQAHPKWLDFAREASEERQKRGCTSPLSLSSTVGFFLLEETMARKLGIETDEVIFNDTDALTVAFDRILADEELRKRLIFSSGFLLPDRSGSIGYLNHQDIIGTIVSTQTSGLLLDLGCGVGYNTEDWAKVTPFKVVGIDRQYHDNWYGEYWKSKNPRLSFLRADFMEGLPFGDNSASAVILETVVHNTNSEGLARGLAEIKRVLKPGIGTLAVGPQSHFSGSPIPDWRIFRKKLELQTGIYALVEEKQ